MLVNDGKVAGHHSAGAALHEAERLLLARRVQVVKEDPPDAPGLPSVADVEVSVTPGQKKKSCKSSVKINRWLNKKL